MTSSAESDTDRARKRGGVGSSRTAAITRWPPPPGRWTSSSTTSGAVAADGGDGGVDVGGLADDLDPVGQAEQLGAHTGPEQRVVVDEDDAHRHEPAPRHAQLDLGAVARSRREDGGAAEAVDAARRSTR